MKQGPRREVEDGGSSYESRVDNTERILIAMVLKEVLREFLPQRETPRNRRDKALAREWIFEAKERSDRRLLGFDFICSYLGLDPGKVRAKILELEKGGRRRELYTSLVRVYPPGRKSRAKINYDEEV